jgi:integrase/recombinase XerC
MIDPFLKYLSFEKRYSQHTVLAYEKDLNQFASFLHDNYEISDPVEAKHAHLRDWVVSLMESGISPRSANRKIATLKSFFKFLLSRDYVEINPTTKLKPLKTSKVLPSFVKEEEIAAMLDKIEFGSDLKGTRDQLLLELFYATGMRLSELTGLKNSDISLYNKTIKVLGKRNKERIIPISESLTILTERYRKLKEEEGMLSEFLILTDTGDKAYPMFIQRKVKSYLQAVTTLSKKSPHVLRHSFATHLLNKGADLNAVKDLLGHTSLAATQVYTHNSIEKLKVAFDQAHPKA